MSHNLHSCIVKGKPKQEKVCHYNLQSVNLYQDLYLLSLPDKSEKELYHIVDEVVGDLMYAVVQTDYFGGFGEQSACVRQNKKELMPCRTDSFGPINEALKLMGIKRNKSTDEFDVVGLVKYRDGFPDRSKTYEALSNIKDLQIPTDLESWKEFVDNQIEKSGRDAILDLKYDPVSKNIKLKVLKGKKS